MLPTKLAYVKRISHDLKTFVRKTLLYNCGDRYDRRGNPAWKDPLATERDVYAVKALGLISDSVADEAKRLSDTLHLSVEEVLTQALGLLSESGVDQHRSRIRKFWGSLTPEERKERAAKASRARWDKQKNAAQPTKPDSASGPEDDVQATSAKKAGT